jgi:hypothetical protein
VGLRHEERLSATTLRILSDIWSFKKHCDTQRQSSGCHRLTQWTTIHGANLLLCPQPSKMGNQEAGFAMMDLRQE